MVKRYNCTNGGAQWCQGCYTMDRDDEYGEYVLHEDYSALERDRDQWKAKAEIAESVAQAFANIAIEMTAKQYVDTHD